MKRFILALVLSVSSMSTFAATVQYTVSGTLRPYNGGDRYGLSYSQFEITIDFVSIEPASVTSTTQVDITDYAIQSAVVAFTNRPNGLADHTELLINTSVGFRNYSDVATADKLTISGGKAPILGFRFSEFSADIWPTALPFGETSLPALGNADILNKSDSIHDYVQKLGIGRTGMIAPAWQLTSDISPVPIPAAAWLFGSALGLLGWMRIRGTRPS